MSVQGKDNSVQVLKRINSVDFGIIEAVNEAGVSIKTVHGDVLIVKGAYEDDAERLMTFGIVDGEDFGRVAFYKPMDEIEQIISGKESE